jgi:hypothetical protein
MPRATAQPNADPILSIEPIDHGAAGPCQNMTFVDHSPGHGIARGGERLVIARAGRRLAGPLDIILREGRVTALVGPSGVGKTTSGDTLLGIATPAAGAVRWFSGALEARRRRQMRARFQKARMPRSHSGDGPPASPLTPQGRDLGSACIRKVVSA